MSSSCTPPCLCLLLLCWMYAYGAGTSDIHNDDKERRYRPAFNRSLAGKPFAHSVAYLSSLGIPPTRFSELSGDFTKQFVIVTAASQDHFEESMDSVASVQQHFKNRRLLYFDLGLSQSQVNLLLPDGGQGAARRIICDVEYRKFDFSRYPDHVRDLFVYSWKFLIIKEMLEEFGAVFWIDSSVRFKTGNFMHELSTLLTRSGGIALFSQTGHSNYAVTDERLYDYLPTDVEAQKTVEQWEGGNLVVYNTREVYENVLKWMYHCVLEKECILPGGVQRRGCRFGKDRYRERAGCHRHDQATLNLLLANWFQFKTENYVFSKRKVNQVIRYPSKFHRLRQCEPLPSVNSKAQGGGENVVRFLPRTEL